MKAARSPLVTALVLGVLVLAGCGRLIWPGSAPRAPRLDPRGGTYSEGVEVRFDDVDGSLFTSADPDALLTEFNQVEQWKDGYRIYVSKDTTLRAYVISEEGLRSPVVREEYVIRDENPPEILANGIWQGFVGRYGYEVNWDAYSPDDTGGRGNPHDDVTAWYQLEFAVYCSTADNISTLEEAETNAESGSAMMVKAWHSAETSGSVGFLSYETSEVGERRYFNVFVRDTEGNSSAYGTVRFETLPPPPDIVAGARAWIHPRDFAFDPLYIDADSELGHPPPFDVAMTYASELWDMDDDGIDDLILSYRDFVPEDHQAWFRATGNGSFEDSPNYFIQSSLSSALDIHLADMNMDGRVDVVFPTQSELVAYSEAGGSAVMSLADAGIEAFDIGDINNDGFPDIVTASPLDPTVAQRVRVWINDGAGGFIEEAQLGVDNDDPYDILVDDLDGDGYDDVLISNGGIPNDPVQRYYGTATGAVVNGSVPLPTDYAARLATLDWDGDGLLEIACSTVSTLELHFLDTVSDPAGRQYFGGPDFSQASVSALTVDLEVADVNDDGRPDLIESFAANDAIIWVNDEPVYLTRLPVSYTLSPGPIATGRLR